MNQHRLQIHLKVPGERGYFPSYLPVSVVDARGQVLSAGTANTNHSTELLYERDEAPLFVRLTLPNGTTETRSLQTPDRKWHEEMEFSIGDTAISNWMAWSALRLDMKRHGGALLSLPGMKNAWFQLWERMPNSSHWQQIQMEPELTNLPSSQDAIQLELRRSILPRALVVRLDSDTPQVVALPHAETIVLVTSLRTLSGVVTPRVVVGGYSPNAEAIMEFLRAGKLTTLESMLDPGNELANRLLRGKFIDPIGATAAAYYLLRKRDWDRLPASWLDNLAREFKDIPDAQLIRASSQIGRGMPINQAANLAVETLSHFLDQGIPLFAEANSLLSDLLALANKAERPLDTRTAKTLRQMLAAFRPLGLSFGFTGEAPNKPALTHEAFEPRQEKRNGRRLAESIREMRTFTDFESTHHKLLFLLASSRLGTDELWSAKKQAVPGSAEKTLFLKSVLDEADFIRR